MGWTLSQALVRRIDQGIKDVRRMLSDLRSAWQIAAVEVRRNQPSLVSGQSRPLALVG